MAERTSREKTDDLDILEHKRSLISLFSLAKIPNETIATSAHQLAASDTSAGFFVLSVDLPDQG